MIYETIQGHRIELHDLDEDVRRFVDRVGKEAERPGATEASMVSLVYSDANPLLEESPIAGAPLATKETLANPAYRVLTDMIERVRCREKGIDLEKVASEYTVGVSEAALRLGMHESGVRQAIQSGRLSSWFRGGRHYLHPKQLDRFAEQEAGRTRRGPTPDPQTDEISFRAGNKPGTSFRVKLPGTARVRKGSDRSASGTVREWKRVGVLSGGKGRYRFFELAPGGRSEKSIELGGFYVRGAFRVVRKENNARRAQAAWQAFEPA